MNHAFWKPILWMIFAIAVVFVLIPPAKSQVPVSPPVCNEEEVASGMLGAGFLVNKVIENKDEIHAFMDKFVAGQGKDVVTSITLYDSANPVMAEVYRVLFNVTDNDGNVCLLAWMNIPKAEFDRGA